MTTFLAVDGALILLLVIHRQPAYELICRTSLDLRVRTIEFVVLAAKVAATGTNGGGWRRTSEGQECC